VAASHAADLDSSVEMNVADSDKIATGGDRNEPPVAGRAALSNKLSNLMFCKVHKCHGDTSTSSIYEPIGAPEVPHETELDFWGGRYRGTGDSSKPSDHSTKSASEHQEESRSMW
jgi:hypothetical protein